MDVSQRVALWIIATGVIACGLYFLREPLIQIALAFILFLSIDGMCRIIRRWLPFIPGWLSLPIALVFVLSITALVAYLVITNIAAMAGDFPVYATRVNALITHSYAVFHIPGPAPTVASLIARLDPTKAAAALGEGVGAFASEAVFILIYLGFLFPASGIMSRKLDRIFHQGPMREAARGTFQRIRESMEKYLWVQTVLSLITTVLSFITLLIFGVKNALFWSFVIFFLNYIPTVGSIAVFVLIALVAVVQFSSLAMIAGVTIAVSAWQFIIGNFLAPRMTGDSLNLSAFIVLLALAVWSAIWGLAGAFLSAPLTVMLMIVLAQFRATRWIAILLSADGKPTELRGAMSKSPAASL